MLRASAILSFRMKTLTFSYYIYADCTAKLEKQLKYACLISQIEMFLDLKAGPQNANQVAILVTNLLNGPGTMSDMFY